MQQHTEGKVRRGARPGAGCVCLCAGQVWASEQVRYTGVMFKTSVVRTTKCPPLTKYKLTAID